jgi:transcriptional regulator with GAF, ATPase, and Fis domain
MFYYLARLHLGYLFEDYGTAFDAAQQARRIAPHLSGTIWPVLLHFWGGLTLAACYGDATEDEQSTYRQDLAQSQATLAVLAENCPENFLCQSLLLAAELERLTGRPLAAMDKYEQALRYARETNSVQYQALANDVYARFCLQRGQERIAAALLNEARSWYEQWGAAAKVAALEHRYTQLLARPVRPNLRLPIVNLSTPALSETAVGDLDVATVMKAAQAIASEIELEKLLATLMRLAIENAGAKRGCLLLEHEGELCIYTEGSLDAPTVRMRHPIPLSEAHRLPTSIVHYVRRTLENVVLADARSDDLYGIDPYIRRYQPRSVLCVPVRTQGRLLGVLYLENTVASGVFSSARIQMLQMLFSQAAISLENALLYDEMKQEVTHRRAAEADLRTALAEVEQLKNRLQTENVYLQEEIRQEHNFEEMVGSSPALLHMLQQVESVAATDATVLVYGETGTGKELIVRALHNHSARKDRPLVKVNCGAIAAGLVESELFGHVKGAFTGALERRVGRFELAHGGTIFLDEVGELSLETQVKLLRVLQEQEFEPVGSSRTVRVDVRIIAATNRDLEDAVQAGRFRADLFYRLNVFPLQVPPLRERRSDIPQLVMFFIARFTKKLGKKIEAVPHEIMELLTTYPWPGNIRELQNLIERAVVLSPGSILRLDRALLPAGTMNPEAVLLESRGSRPLRHGRDSDLRRPLLSPAPEEALTLEAVERRHILTVLQQTGGVIEGPQGAARLLNLHPNTLRSRMKKLGVKRSDHAIS